MSACECGACARRFTGVGPFDSHLDVDYSRQPPVRCLDPAARGMKLSESGRWGFPPDEAGRRFFGSRKGSASVAIRERQQPAAGTGVSARAGGPPDPVSSLTACPVCNGDGTIRDGNMECPGCDGTGEADGTPPAKGQAPVDVTQGNSLAPDSELRGRGWSMTGMPPAAP